MLERNILRDVTQPSRQATAEGVLGALSEVCALPWAAQKHRTVPLYPGGPPPGCTLGVRVSSQSQAVALLAPSVESMGEWETRTGRHLPPVRPDTDPEEYGRLYHAHCDLYEREPRRVVGFTFLLLPPEHDVLCPTFRLAHLYSQAEAADVIRPHARHGYAWCAYPEFGAW